MKKLNDLFLRIADAVSFGMGTPTNIFVWIIAVVIWFLLFALNPQLQNSNFLPQWFTSTAFNFPLNTITTLAELYIGFLVAAAANRSERRNKQIMENIEHMMKEQDDILQKLIEYQEKELSEEQIILEKITVTEKEE